MQSLSLEASPPMGTWVSLSLAALRWPSPSRAALRWPSRAALRWPSPWLRLWPVQLWPWSWPWRWPVGQRLQSPAVLRP